LPDTGTSIFHGHNLANCLNPFSMITTTTTTTCTVPNSESHLSIWVNFFGRKLGGGGNVFSLHPSLSLSLSSSFPQASPVTPHVREAGKVGGGFLGRGQHGVEINGGKKRKRRIVKRLQWV
jgi:hypothetical protein